MTKTVAILGAGPVGLAAAAHVLERGMAPLILEQGDAVGHAIRAWSHVPMFSNWRYNIDAAARRRLEATGWQGPAPDAYPTGADLVTVYLEPLGKSLAPWLHFGRHVVAVSREGIDKVKDAGREAAPFLIETEGAAGPEWHRADAVIDATGTWFQPNPGGAGRPVPGEAGNTRISYGMPDVAGQDRARFAGKRVAVLGGGHSAVGTLIALSDLRDTRVVWLCRAQTITRALGGGAADQLSARGALGTDLERLVEQGSIRVEGGFHLASVTGAGPLQVSAADGRRVDVDELVIATGFRPHLSFLRELRVALDPALECPPALAPLIDPNQHSCGTVRPHGALELAHPEPGFYIAGMKSYGRAPTFLLATGHEQVRSIVAALAGDLDAAARVELVLPETGVCSGPGPQAAETVAASCCGGPAKTRADACCARDEVDKDRGAPGCGCATAVEPAKAAACC
ncbi:MAG: FAD-dependent oxidoreductase [Rhodobacterales bacterium 65-51]|uniref:NAD(P)-binding domain-containing protein n=1 Tax=uncultured Gemmobacter sp. TaxID=1095917 RepID=UPI000966DCA7|nr:NAD(P)-binding domain-containing protein [uncultured Gemmobacter sp.]OJY30059.1 MAG: FAD-dependent oxidoreductase [Rhodobacterales bacterium 65-51]